MSDFLSANERDVLRQLLKDHHDHHLNAGTLGLSDGEGGWIEIDNGAEYSDSALYLRTVAALEGLPPDEAAPMPRGGITAHWWQVSVLERRRRRALQFLLAEVQGWIRQSEVAAPPNLLQRLRYALHGHLPERRIGEGL